MDDLRVSVRAAGERTETLLEGRMPSSAAGAGAAR
jgi:hypothetical protein